jgi:hypothetical protein
MFKKFFILIAIFLLCTAGQAFALSFTPPVTGGIFLGDAASSGPDFLTIELTEIDTAQPVNFTIEARIDPNTASNSGSWERSGTAYGDYFRYGTGSVPSSIPAGTQLAIDFSNGFYDGVADLIKLVFSITFSSDIGQMWLYADTTGGDEMWRLRSFNATQSVPEPATMLMLGIGLLGIAGISRRRITK